VLLALAVHAWLALSATVNESTTVDELAHLTAGHALWARGDYRLQPENGVLPQFVEGIPAVLEHRRLPPPGAPGWAEPNVWTLGNLYFHRLGNDLPALLLHGRAMNVLWSLATALLVFWWSRRLFGLGGAAVSLLFWAFSPTFLAHGALATSDMCMTFFMLASVTAYWASLRHGSPRTLLASAAVTALACVAKYTAVLLPAMFAVLAATACAQGLLSWRGRRIEGRTKTLMALLASTCVHVVVAWVVIWAFHRFRYTPVTDPTLAHDYTRPWATVLASLGGAMAQALAWARLHHALPDAYLYGFAFVVDLSHSRGAFLNGATSLRGWVQFFPYAFLVKTPLGLLIALAGSLIVIVRRLFSRGASAGATQLLRVAPLLALFVVYWAASLTSSLNIGQRHLLPTYPVLFIAVGALGWAWSHDGAIWRWLLALTVAAQVAASTAIRPHYLAFFNQLAGGPSEGYRHLVDSSLDWGQDLPGLAAWLKTHDLPNDQTPVYLAYFGTGEPEYYGIKATPMVPLLRTLPDQPWHALHAGVYCVSATLLQQAYSPIRGAWNQALETEFQDLRALEPALIDYDQHPSRRPAWEQSVPAAKWQAMWHRYEELRFTRLCYLLRAREPDAQIGYSINIYRVSAADADAVTGSMHTWTNAIAHARDARGRASKPE